MMDDADLDEIRAAIFRELSVPLWPVAGKALGLTRNSTYAAARRGEIPTNTFKGRKTTPTAPLRRMLGLEEAA